MPFGCSENVRKSKEISLASGHPFGGSESIRKVKGKENGRNNLTNEPIPK